MKDAIYDPEFVADLFDRCSLAYRRWSAIGSFGMIWAWRRRCVLALPRSERPKAKVVDLMAGTGELWPHLLKHHPTTQAITAIDISKGMHLDAVSRLHASREDRIEHICANALETDLPAGIADMVVSSFGLKTFERAQQKVLAQQIARLLKSGGHFSLIEAGDPIGWKLRPLYRFHLAMVLPLIERLFLKGAQDFAMINIYTRNFQNCSHFAQCLRDAGLDVTYKEYFFGCASGISGHKPMP